MRLRHLLICASVLLFSLVTAAEVQKGEWSDVQVISPGSRISILTDRWHKCYFLRATNEDLFCSNEQRPGFETTFQRSDLRQVRVSELHPSTVIGVVIGIGTGVAIGSAGGSGSLTRGGTMATLGGLLGLVGGFLGHAIPHSTKITIFEQSLHLRSDPSQGGTTEPTSR